MELKDPSFLHSPIGWDEKDEDTYACAENKILKQEIKKLSSELLEKGKQLERVTLYLESILKNIHEGLIFVSHTGIITTYNTAAEKILGVKQKDVLFTNFLEKFTDDVFGFSMTSALKNLFSPGSLVIKYTRKGYQEKEIEVSTSAVFRKSKTIKGIIVSLRDVTGQRLKAKREHYNIRMQELSRLSAIVAHEIRNPLGGIEGFASLIQGDLKQSHPDLSKMAGYIVDGSKTISNLIENVLRSARTLTPQVQDTDIIELVKDVKKQIEIDPSFSEDIELCFQPYDQKLSIPTDKLMLKSCLLHLLRNAYQAIDGRGSVHVTIFSKQNSAIITVKDSGCGIEKEILDKLFSPFFTTKEKGTGLGLYETYRMLQTLGGTIEVKSSVECGTLFIITLPIKGYIT